MFVELLSASERERLYREHASMTVRALIVLFDWDAQRARLAVEGVWESFHRPDVSASTRNSLLHEDPVNLALDLAQETWGTLLESRSEQLAYFNQSVRPEFERQLSGCETAIPVAQTNAA